MAVNLYSIVLSMSDEEVRKWVERMRRRLGYFDLPEIEPREPGPFARFIQKVFTKIGDFFVWLFQSGSWKLVAAALALFLLFLIFQTLRKIRLKKRSDLAEGLNSEGEGERVILWNKNKDQWLQSMQEHLKAEEYDLAVVSLYRANLAGILEKKKLQSQLSNREISLHLPPAWRNYFTRLYKASDAVVFGNRHCEAMQFDALYNQYRELAL